MDYLNIIWSGLFSWLIRGYYYKKGIRNRSLTPYLDYISGALSGVDYELKNQLKIYFKDEQIEDLVQIRFVIANDGDKAIMNLIEPLTLQIPNEGIVLDCKIEEVFPLGRKVSFDILKNKKEVNFSFPLLNPGEYFILKLLIRPENKSIPELLKINNEVYVENQENHFSKLFNLDLYKFRICSEDLPPFLKINQLNEYRVAIKDEKEDIEQSLIFILSALVYSFICYIVYYLLVFKPDLNPINFSLFFQNFTLIKFSIMFCLILGILNFGLGIVGIIIMGKKVIEKIFKKKHIKFIYKGS